MSLDERMNDKGVVRVQFTHGWVSKMSGSGIQLLEEVLPTTGSSPQSAGKVAKHPSVKFTDVEGDESILTLKGCAPPARTHCQGRPSRPPTRTHTSNPGWANRTRFDSHPRTKLSGLKCPPRPSRGGGSLEDLNRWGPKAWLATS